MSLSEQEQHALHSIEDRLTGSDPRLASLLATFTRLTSGEEMPVREKIRAARRRATRSGRRSRRHPPLNRISRRARRLYQRLGWQQTPLLLWLLITITLIAIALAINRSSGNATCTELWPVVCSQQAPAHNARPSAPKTEADQTLHPWPAPHRRVPALFEHRAFALDQKPGGYQRHGDSSSVPVRLRL